MDPTPTLTTRTATRWGGTWRTGSGNNQAFITITTPGEYLLSLRASYGNGLDFSKLLISRQNDTVENGNTTYNPDLTEWGLGAIPHLPDILNQVAELANTQGKQPYLEQDGSVVMDSYSSSPTFNVYHTYGTLLFYKIRFSTSGDYFVNVYGQKTDTADIMPWDINIMNPGTVSGAGITGFNADELTWQHSSGSTPMKINIPTAGDYEFYINVPYDFNLDFDRLWLTQNEEDPENGSTDYGPDYSPHAGQMGKAIIRTPSVKVRLLGGPTPHAWKPAVKSNSIKATATPQPLPQAPTQKSTPQAHTATRVNGMLSGHSSVLVSVNINASQAGLNNLLVSDGSYVNKAIRKDQSMDLPTKTPSGTLPTPTRTATSTPTFTPTPTSAPSEPVPEPFQSAKYLYDGDGNLVKSVVTSTLNHITTTYYPGKNYTKEVTTAGEKIQKYYSAAGTTVAVRTIVNNTDTLQWLLTDHLGSTSVTANQDGTWNSEIRYTAFGEIRSKNGITPTDYRYTGQLDLQPSIGLDYYVARFYDPSLARFVQPDSIVPDPTNVNAFDRYVYVYNNPIGFNDPSGYFSENQIMDYFEVKTWDEVLSIFNKGGKLENRWGILELLRQGEQGDKISTGANFDDLFAGEGNYSQGGWFCRSNDGSIDIMANDYEKYGFGPLDQQEMVSFFKTPLKAGAYGIKAQRWYGEISFSTEWWKRGENLGFRPGSVDWTSAGLDTISVGASLFGANSASNTAKVAGKVGVEAGILSTVKSSMIDRNLNSTLLSAGGFIPGPVGGGFSLASLCINLANGVYFGP